MTAPPPEDTTRSRVVHHEPPCGERIACPIHGLALGPHYLPAEKLRNGWIVAHDCGQTWRPSELSA